MSPYNEHIAGKISINIDEIQNNVKQQVQELQKNVKKSLVDALDPNQLETKTNEIINFSLKLSSNVSKISNRSLSEVKPFLEEIERDISSAYETTKSRLLLKLKEVCDKEKQNKKDMQ